MGLQAKGNLLISVRDTGSFVEVTMSGVVDESADFEPLQGLDGNLRMSLKGLRRFNSVGIRLWMDVIRELAERTQLVFLECPPPVIDQLNMIQGFLGHARVESFFGHMHCDHCAKTDELLFRSKDIRYNDMRIPEISCKQCSRLMELDEIEDQYLLFLREPTQLPRLP